MATLQLPNWSRFSNGDSTPKSTFMCSLIITLLSERVPSLLTPKSHVHVFIPEQMHWGGGSRVWDFDFNWTGLFLTDPINVFLLQMSFLASSSSSSEVSFWYLARRKWTQWNYGGLISTGTLLPRMESIREVLPTELPTIVASRNNETQKTRPRLEWVSAVWFRLVVNKISLRAGSPLDVRDAPRRGCSQAKQNSTYFAGCDRRKNAAFLWKNNVTG